MGIYVDPSFNEHGFLYSNSVFTTIDVPGAESTFPAGINNSGEIVGTWEQSPFNFHIFLFTNGTFSTVDLPSNFGASGINDSGQIVGSYSVQDTTGVHQHGYLATPVPEPTSLLLLTGGAAALATLLWWRKLY